MNKQELDKILADHLLWLKDEGGKRANLREADLQDANLQDANLQRANLRGAHLQGANLREADLQDANLQGAYLQGAYLQDANLQDANLQEANLQEANLRGVDLQDANLRGANLDYSSGIPFHCGGTMAVIDNRLFAQMVYHLTRQDNTNLSDENKEWLKSIPKNILNSFCKYRDDLKVI